MTGLPQKIVDALQGDQAAISTYLRGMYKFDKYFCELMMDGTDFTLRMEVRGNKGELIHCRVNNDGFEQPSKKKPPSRSKFDTD